MDSNTPIHSPAAISSLANSSTKFSKVTMETDYGLILELGPGKSVAARLRDDVVVSQEPSNKLGFKYSIFTDWGADYLWYGFNWPGNDPEDDGQNVPTEQLMQEQGEDVRDTVFKAWAESWEKWYDIYHNGFHENLVKPGDFSAEPIPDPKDRKAWAIQGMLLAVWLALLPSTASVKYDSYEGKVLLDRKATGEASLDNSLARYLEELNLRFENVDDPEVQG